MKDVNLFRDPKGFWVTTSHLVTALEKVKAADARILYVHSAISFGSPNPNLSRGELLGWLYEVVLSLGVPTICVPTFTFSFCNGQNYSVQTSASKMGALNEYIRRLPEALRSIDPLLSTTLVGDDRDLVTTVGTNSIGENCTFDKLHSRGAAAKFLFLGTTVSECFTYSHYIEERLAVPYRYNRAFTGKITNGDHIWEDTYTLFVRYKGVQPSAGGMLERELLNRGFLRQEPFGASSISCVGEPEAYETIVEHLQQNVSCYIAADPGDRDTAFSTSSMVAL